MSAAPRSPLVVDDGRCTPPLEVWKAAVTLSSTPVAVVAATEPDPQQWRFAWTNRAFDRLIGKPAPELDGWRVGDVEERALVLSGGRQEGLAHLLRTDGGRLDVTLRRGDGALVPARLTVFRLDVHADSWWVVEVAQIREEVRADDELRASEARFRGLATHAPIGIFASDGGLRLGYVNDRCAELFDRTPEQLRSTAWLDALAGEDLETVVSGLTRVLEGDELDVTIRVGQRRRWVRMRAAPIELAGRGVAFIGSLEDVDAVKRQEELLAHQAEHDPLTGLPNRLLLTRELDAVLADRRSGGSNAALLFFDLDGFKLVNDTLGHNAGDELLLEVARRLSDALREGDMLARFGGDEFVALCGGVASPEQGAEVARRLLGVFDARFPVGGRRIGVSASIGVALGDRDGVTAESLMRDADVAMYQAKTSGKARFAVFDEGARARAAERLDRLAALRHAIDEDQLEVHYQPVVALEDDAVYALEALVRWRQADGSLAAPATFLPLAEQEGLIAGIGRWVLDEGCRQLRALLDLGLRRCPQVLAVNVSGVELREPSYAEAALATLGRHGLPGSSLTLELREDCIAGDDPLVRANLSELQRAGVQIAIDNFGTGFAALAALRDAPVDTLKIDRSLIAGIDDRPGDVAILGALSTMAHTLGLRLVVEGVETARQLELVRRLGCSMAQGYFLGRPQEARAIAARLRAPHAPHRSMP